MPRELPHDIHAHIIAHVARSADDQLSAAQLDALRSLCLVSRSFRAEAQALLFRASPFWLSPQTDDRFWATLRESPHHGALVKSVKLEASGDTERFISDLDLVPNLVEASNVSWPWFTAPPPRVRPALRSLALCIAEDASDARPLSDWLDLAHLEKLSVTPLGFNRVSCLSLSFLSGIPSTAPLTSFSMDHLQADVVPPLLQQLRNFTRIQRLHLHPAGRPAPMTEATNPLVVFPRLRVLRLHGWASYDGLLETSHPCLEELVISYPCSAADRQAGVPHSQTNSGYGPSHPVHAFVDALVRLAPAQFPSLQAFGFAGESVAFDVVDFADGVPQQMGGVRSVARKVRAAGLALHDWVGQAWDDAWFEAYETDDDLVGFSDDDAGAGWSDNGDEDEIAAWSDEDDGDVGSAFSSSRSDGERFKSDHLTLVNDGVERTPEEIHGFGEECLSENDVGSTSRLDLDISIQDRLSAFGLDSDDGNHSSSAAVDPHKRKPGRSGA